MKLDYIKCAYCDSETFDRQFKLINVDGQIKEKPQYICAICKQIMSDAYKVTYVQSTNNSSPLSRSHIREQKIREREERIKRLEQKLKNQNKKRF